MKFDFRALSIKTKVTLVATGFLLALLVLVSTLQLHRVTADIREVVGNQQFTLLSRVADELDQKLEADLQLVAVAAHGIRAEALTDTAELQRLLDGNPNLRSTFDGLFVISARGVVLADSPAQGRRGNDIGEQDNFKDVLATGKPRISRPLLGKTSRQPTVTVSAPIFGRDGAIAGVFMGTLNLLKPNVLGSIGDAKVGRTGAFALFGRDRTIVVSHDRERIMTQGPAPGVSPYFDHATAGKEGWEEGVNSRGLHALFSYKPLRAAPWVLVAVLPVAEAYAPVTKAQRSVVAISAALGLLLAPVVWFGTRRILAPLLALRDAIRTMRDDPAARAEVPVARPDEIGDLAADFNALMQQRRRAEDALRMSERRLQMIADSMPALIAHMDTGQRFCFVNSTVERWYGVERERYLGRPLREMLGATAYALVEQQVQRVLAGETVRYQRDLVEASVPRHVDVTYVPELDSDGKVAGFYVLINDVTEHVRVQRELSDKETRLRAMFEQAAVGMAVIDNDGHYLDVNQKMCDIVGYPRQELIGMHFSRITHPDDLAVTLKYSAMRKRGEIRSHSQEKRYLTREGKVVWVNVAAASVCGADGRSEYLISVVKDISERKRAESALRESEARFRAMSDASPLGIFVTDAGGGTTYVNSMYLQTSGLTVEQALGHGWRNGIHPEDRERVVAAWEQAVREQSEFDHESRYLRPDGKVIWTRVRASPFADGDSVLGHVGTVEDITDRKTEAEQLTYRAHFDGLTGLPNRSLFSDRLAQALGRTERNGQLVALMYLDIDRFKSINDSLGHAIGDTLLEQFAERLRQSVRSVDTVARLGGDEFVILMQDLRRHEDVYRVAHAIIEAMQPTFDVAGVPLRITTSIGIAFAGSHDASGENLLKRADVALYRAKRAGRNQFHVAPPALAEVAAPVLSPA